MRILQILAISIALVVLLTGCATATKMNRISVGMTKQEVVSVLGGPESTSAPGSGIEILRYHLLTPPVEEYFVKIANGKVVSYGKVGDFDSTKDPTLDLNIKSR